MKSASVWAVAAAAAVLLGATVRAETDAEYLHPGVPRKAGSPVGAGSPPPVPARPRASNPVLFAPGAAANTRRLSAQQREEWRFLKEAAAASRFDADASRLALSKSSRPAIRSFATELVNHHASVSNELVHMLHVRGMALPMLSNGQRKTLDRLAKLNGAKFDREYVEAVGPKTQQENQRLFEKARVATVDPQLKAWIERVLPILGHHLTLAERLAPAVSRLPDRKLMH